MDRLGFLDHAPIHFHFRQTNRDFIVEELPLYPFSGNGEHLVLKIRKKNLTTWQMLQAISERTGAKVSQMGYAGLKDKEAMTIQYVTLPKIYENEIAKLDHPQIKILDATYHNNKLRIGHLKGNRFFVRLKKVGDVEALKINEALGKIGEQGMPNYFGYQRFGRDKQNYELGRLIVEGKRKERDRKKRKLFVNAYQSHLFNLWLSKRVEMSKLIDAFSLQELTTLLDLPSGIIKELKQQEPFFKIFPGDIACHYPFGKYFEVLLPLDESRRFASHQISITGLLPGTRAVRAKGLAGSIEKDFDADIREFGDRRFAWVFVQELEGRYIAQEGWFELGFVLPRGCYATVLIEQIANRPIEGGEEDLGEED